MNQIKREIILDEQTKKNLKEIQKFVLKVTRCMRYKGYICSEHYMCYCGELEDFVNVCDCLLDDNIQIYR